jgi:hypothetical protein
MGIFFSLYALVRQGVSFVGRPFDPLSLAKIQNAFEMNSMQIGL